MRKRSVGKSVFFLTLAAAFVSCRQMDTMITTTSAAYTLGATVDERDLGDYAVVDAEGVIRPVFASDSTKDPDAVAFRVELYDQAGDSVAEAVEYRIRGAAARSSADATLIMVDSLSEELPAFSLPADLPVGRYSLSLRILGGDGILYEKSRSFFYVADEGFSFISLASYPPGSGPASRAPVFPTKIPLLLEATVQAGAGLDPYIAWSFGGKLISAGRVSEGAARVLWTSPGSAGFYRIDAVLYPVVPREEELADLPGIRRSLTIATSPSAAYPGLTGKNEDFASIYRFLGNLSDSGSAGFEALSPGYERRPEWLPFSSGYGAAIGPLRILRADRPAATLAGGRPASTRIMISAAPRAAGILYRAVFKGAGTSQDDLVLRLEATAAGSELGVLSGGVNKIAAAKEASPFDGELRLYRIDLSASADDPATALVSFYLGDALIGEIKTAKLELSSGAGYFELGGAEASDTKEMPDSIVAVVDDLASMPIPPIDGGARETTTPGQGTEEIVVSPSE